MYPNFYIAAITHSVYHVIYAKPALCQCDTDVNIASRAYRLEWKKFCATSLMDSPYVKHSCFVDYKIAWFFLFSLTLPLYTRASACVLCAFVVLLYFVYTNNSPAQITSYMIYTYIEFCFFYFMFIITRFRWKVY